MIIYPGVEAEPILRDVLLRQVSDTSIMVVASAAYTTAAKFVSIASPVCMSAQKSLLIMLFTSLYLS